MNIRVIATRYAAVDWNSPKFKFVEYAIAAADVAYGFYVWSFLAIGVGILGAAATFWGLNARIVRAAQGAMRRWTLG